MTMRIAVSGGGTGGHIYPAIAVARYALDKIEDASVLFVGSRAGPEAAAAQAAGIPFKGLDVAGVVGKSPVKAASALIKFARASRECRAVLREEGVQCVLGTGGYASAPACDAALKLGIPLIIHEMNFEPGLVTRRFSRRAAAVAVAYEGTAGLLPRGAAVRVTGVPVRPEIAALASTEARARARMEAVEEFGLERGRLTLLVFGGSQGAMVLNEALWNTLGGLRRRADLQIVHLVGRKNFQGARRSEAQSLLESEQLVYRPFDYQDRMDLVYAISDLALSRAGAGTIAELMAAGLPAVLVPFPHAAGGHQEKNAKALARTGAVCVVPQDGQSAQAAVDLALETIGDPAALERMKEAVAAATRPDGAKGIADLIEEVT